jgi:hypothetical protein
MTDIIIKIECDGDFCGECRMSTLGYCNAFEKELESEDKRLPECNKADMNSKPFHYFNDKYNVQITDNEKCCMNCKKFIIDNSGKVYKFSGIKTLKVIDVQIGECLQAKEERNPTTNAMHINICDAYEPKEGDNGNGK